MTEQPIFVHLLDAGKKPERPALVGDVPMSYGELIAVAKGFAARLRRRQSAIGDRVAIWLPKGSHYVCAIHGAQLAGCAIVPLDAEQPVERVCQVLRDAEPVALVTCSSLLPALSERGIPTTLRCIFVRPDDSRPYGETVGRAETVVFAIDAPPTESGEGLPAVVPGDLAAVLYTSGSTGTPKGVRISHLNLATFIDWAVSELDISDRDVFANHASFNFDLSTFDLYGAARVGAPLWVIPESDSRNVAALMAGLTHHRVTVLYCVPSILALLATSGVITGADTERLRYVLFAGEVFPIRGLRALKSRLPATCQLYNLYGPTETNVCTYHRVTDDDLNRETPVPIGLPVSGARAHLVDEYGRVVHGSEVNAEGTTGELVIAGPCVTPGYFRREDPSNAANHRGGCHATGDIVAVENGVFVYHGRKDRMVKVNGYRVELGEIEHVVRCHSRIAQAAVVATVRGSGTRITVLYTPRQGDLPVSLLELKRHCREFLPRYMVPQAAMALSSLPVNRNGKLDYPELQRRAESKAQEHVCASTATREIYDGQAKLTDILGRQ